MNTDVWIILVAGVACLLLTVFLKKWWLAAAAFLAFCGLIVYPGVNQWLQYSAIALTVGSLFMAVELGVEGQK